MNRVLIVGGGASGALVAINIARKARVETSVVIADPSIFLGRGVAYGTTNPSHLLNVPASRMSALVDEPNHFCESSGMDPNAFAPRRDYANYLISTFVQEQLKNPLAKFEHLRDVVSSIRKVGSRTFEASFEKTAPMNFSHVVLAIGQGDAIEHQGIFSQTKDSRIIRDAWRQEFQPFNGTLVCIGTGLTFIDHALSHIRKSANNIVIGISRTGLLPMPHLPKRALPLDVPESARLSPIALREFIEKSEDWRAAQDGVRHLLPEIWSSWNDDQKSEFVNRDLRWWNVHRHRVSPDIHRELQDSMDAGRVKVMADELLTASEQNGRLGLTLSSGATLEADALINCLGYQSNGTGPLFESLINEGLAVEGPLGWGIRTRFPRHELLNSAGETEDCLYAIGPILLGERFETTAIPELRVQARDIAEAIVGAK